ncbi:hypothetical protein CKK33_07160 [Mucilaginibacter sp. MD40]|uniref:energy transducer TonB n=1 Tax=Mucilaginibacter sp. MD40 TaxID=2029590 RepID=UPI000BAC8245|nr:energy transducer TonB [Mucilaginibacter sp. MD40]PAW93289.1 hypothetical protein CKK33_07160 [Mucilaginibacter sp. MD40]
MKPILSLALFLALSVMFSQAQDSTQNKKVIIFKAIEKVPAYPGGVEAIGRHITQNLKYPEVAKLIGINGRIIISFVIDKQGVVREVTPVNCIGAGCESEAVKVIESLDTWSPGMQDGKPVRVQYQIPISFLTPKENVKFKELAQSDYGFVFNIKGTLYSLNDAEQLLGKSFKSADIALAEPFYNTGDDARFVMPDKKEIYLINIR